MSRTNKLFADILMKQSKKTYLEPYHFVRFNTSIMPAMFNRSNVPQASEIREDLLSGEIAYEMCVKTPLVIKGEFDMSLPASSVRGMFRENLQILSSSSMLSDIENRHLKYRYFHRNKLMKQKYADIMGTSYVRSPNGQRFVVLKNVKAGIIRHDSSGYYILHDSESYACDSMSNASYYDLNLVNIQMQPDWRNNFHVRGPETRNVFDSLSNRSYSSGRGRYAVRGKTISPFYKRVSFNLDNAGKIITVHESHVDKYEGYLLSSSRPISQPQHTFYLIPLPIKPQKIIIAPDIIWKYQRAVLDELQVLEKSYWSLPELNEEKPVFFVNTLDALQFGFTKYFPLVDEQGIHARSVTPKERTFDFCDAIFGFNYEKDHYEGRVSFSDLSIENGECEIKKSGMGGVLASPKPQGFRNYFDSNLMTRGTKCYWLRENIVPFPENVPEKIKDAGPVTVFTKGSMLVGNVRFNNLTSEELGLLLWSLELEKDCEQNLGRFKAFGYGRCSVRISNFILYDNEERYFGKIGPLDNKNNKSGNLTRLWQGGKREGINNGYIWFFETDEAVADYRPYIRLYQRYFKKNNGKAENQRISEFLFMKTLHPELEKEILPYQQWEVSRRNAVFTELSDLSRNVHWAVLDEDEVESVWQKLSWKDFVENPSENLCGNSLYTSIMERFDKLREWIEIFLDEDKYYIRRDILQMIQNLSEFSILSMRQLVHSEKFNDLSYANDKLISYFDRCLDEIQMMADYFDERSELFYDEYSPRISLNDDDNLFISDNSGSYEISLTAINRNGCLPAFVDEIEIENDDIHLVKKCKLVVDGGERKRIRVALIESEFNSLLQDSIVNLILKFSYLSDGKEVRGAAKEVREVKGGQVKTAWTELLNPYAGYVKSGAVENDEMFFGRQELIKEVITSIAGVNGDDVGGKIFILYGQQRSGKSSILAHIAKYFERRLDYIVADLGNIGEIEHTEQALLGEIGTSLFTSCKENKIPGFEDLEVLVDEIFESDEPQRKLKRFIEKVKSIIGDKRQIVLLIDEFTYLHGWIQEGNLKPDFMKFWKAFAQNQRIKIIIVGQDFMPDLINDFRNEFGSAFTKRVNYLERFEAEQLIREPFIRVNKYDAFEDDAVSRICELTACSAFYTMIICNALVNWMNRRKIRQISAFMVNECVKEVFFNPNSADRMDIEIFDALLNDGYFTDYVEDNIDILHAIAVASTYNYECSRAEIVNKLVSEQQYFEGEDILTGLREEKKRQMDIRRQQIDERINRLISRDVIRLTQNKYLSIRVKLFEEWMLYNYGVV